MVALVVLALPGVAGAAMPAGFSDQPMITGLTQPVGVDWAPDGRAFVVEKHGVLKTAAAGASTATTVVDLRNEVNDQGDRGLQDVAVDKQFATNGYVYLAYVKELRPLVADSDAPMTSRLVRLRLNPASGQLADPAEPPLVLLGKDGDSPCPAAPANDLDCMPADSSSHMIGTVKAAADGTLWVGNGDGASFNYADPLAMRTLDPTSLAGKIVHIDRAGNGLPGHAFCPANTDLTDVCAKVHAKGFRNPYRFNLRADGKLVVGDVGWNTREEIDVVDGGGLSFGWPCREGRIATPGYSDRTDCDAYTTATETEPVTDYPHCPANNPPAVCGSAVIGGPEYRGQTFPAGYHGSVFAGDYTSSKIFRLPADGNGGYGQPLVFKDDWAGTDIEVAPGGDDLAYVNFGYGSGPDGVVRRISYTPGNTAPVAAASADKTSGDAPLTVKFDASGSSDPDGDALTYDWDFGDSSAHSSAVKPTHTYTTVGSFDARLTVSDGRGTSASQTIRITAGGSPPEATIAAPIAGSLYRDGDQVQLRGSGNDPDDGSLPASALDWQVILHHGSHTHFDSSFPGVDEATFTTRRDHDADSYYEVRLTVTDSLGLTDTASVDIRPRTTTATIDSTPAGAPVSYGGRAGTTPLSQVTAIGYGTTVTTASAFSSGGRPFRFDHWADGVTANVRDVTVPEAGVDLRAIYVEDKARGMTATASSTQDADPALYGAARAVDGDRGTRWSSERQDDQWWQVDLGSARSVDRVQIDWEAAFASRYRILTSLDGSDWSPAGETTQSVAGSRTTAFATRVARYVRVLGLERGTQFGLSFFEARVLGPADVAQPPEPPGPGPALPPEAPPTPQPAPPAAPTQAAPPAKPPRARPRRKPPYASAVMGTRGLRALFGLGDTGHRAVDAKGGRPGRFRGSPRRAKPLTASGGDGLARAFDGRNDRIRFDPRSLGRPRAFAIELLLKPARNRRTGYLVTAAADRRRDGFSLALDGRGRPVLTAARRGSARPLRILGPRLGRKARQVAVTYDGRRLRLYVDGKRRRTSRAVKLIWSRSRRLVVGADEHGGNRFKGTLDELSLYDRALSGRTVKAHRGASRKR